MKKRMLALAMIFILVLTSTVFAYAEVEQRDTNVVSFAIDRISRTAATATVSTTFSTYVNRYNVVVYLQKKVENRWVSDVSNPDYVYVNNGTNDFSFTFNQIYSHLESGVIYRLKCVSTDYIGNSSYTFTAYSNQF